MGQRIESIAVAIRHILGLSSSSTVGLCSLNRREWLLTDYAVSLCSMVSVPLYPTLSADAISYIAKHAELEMVATDIATVSHIVEVADLCPALKFGADALFGHFRKLKLCPIHQGSWWCLTTSCPMLSGEGVQRDSVSSAHSMDPKWCCCPN